MPRTSSGRYKSLDFVLEEPVEGKRTITVPNRDGVMLLADASGEASGGLLMGNNGEIQFGIRGSIVPTGDGLILMGDTIYVDEALKVSGNVGFYDTAPIAKQTGVAVSAGGVHAALVNLGLIAA